jgi:hypothetical protein
VSGVFPIDPHTPEPEHGPSYIGRMPATIRDAPPGFKAISGTTLEGRVLGRDAAGHLMLRTSNGVLSIATGARPPTGSTVVVQFRAVGAAVQAYIVGVRTDAEREPGTTAPAHPRPAARAPAPYRRPPDSAGGGVTEGHDALTRVWPALEEALTALYADRGAQPGALPHLLARLPQPGAQLGSRLLFVLAALRRGDIRAWLGREPFNALERAGRGDLIARLEDDFAHLARFAAEDGGEWRLYVLPLFLDGHVHQIRVFVHAPPYGETRDDAHRVVAETDLPHLGELQLDTLLRRHRMDMILRTRTPLGEELAARIHALAAQARAWGRMDGDIGFEAGARWRFLALPGQGETPHGLVV